MGFGRIDDVLPEWEAFAHAVRARDPASGTWCEAWTVRDLLIHQTGNAEELRRVLAAHVDGHPTMTRGFEERERPYRAVPDADLWAAFVDQCERLAGLTESAESELDPHTAIAWTGREVTPAFFAEHLRSELVLHLWDMVGDDSSTSHLLGQPWMTAHSVHDVGAALLGRGAGCLGLGPADRIQGRLRAPGTDDLLVTANADDCAIGFVPAEGDADIESDPAARVLLLWGRRPADASRWRSTATPPQLKRLRTLLSGY